MLNTRCNHAAYAVCGFIVIWCVANTTHAASFAATGSMAIARFNHSANLLGSNKVLISGGGNDDNILYGIELYNPTTGTFADAGSMKYARELHSGVRLSSGKVLLPGGWNGTAVITAVDVYDPIIATVAATAVLSVARYSYGLTLLANGKALIAGGIDGNGHDLANTAVYDPTAGTWAATGAMITARSQFNLVRLHNGKVLAVGGWDDTAELYDATTGTWKATGQATAARRNYGAVLLNNGQVLLVGGNDGTVTLKSTELFDPASGSFTATGDMTVARELHTATLLPNGNVLVTGGNDGNNNHLATSEIFNPTTKTWATTSEMSVARQRHTATVLSTGKVLIAGGETVNGATNAAELYTPEAEAATCTLSSTPNPSVMGRNAVFNVVVASAKAVPTGTVTFKANGTTKCATSLNAGKALCGISDLSVGDNTVLVEYAGNINFNACNAQVVHKVLSFPVDFTITNITLTPDILLANSTFSAAVTVHNAGPDSGDARQLSLWLNQSSTMACDANTSISQPVGVVGAQKTKIITFSNLAAGTSGIRTLRAFVDGGCDTAENIETDNQLIKKYRVIPCCIGQADVIITNIAITPVAPLLNSTLKVWITLKNQGTANAAAGKLAVWSNQATTQVCNAVGNKVVDVAALDAGATTVIEITGIAAGTAGTKTLRAFADSTCATVEANETNNQLTHSYTVAAKPDLVVTNVTLTPEIPLPDSTFTAKVTVKNQGSAAGAVGFVDVWTNQPQEQLCGAEGEQYAEGGSLLPGASRTLTFANLPAGAMGAKKFRAFVDSWCTTAEAVEGNNQLVKDYFTTTINTGLVAYYSFNGNANDISGKDQHGTVNGAVLTTDRNNNVNSAYKFNGSGSVILLPNTVLNGLGDISLSAWFKLDDDGLSTLISGANQSQDNEMIIIFRDTPSIYIKGVGSIIPIISTGSWYHFVLTRNGVSGKVSSYLNGLLNSEVNLPTGNLLINTGGLMIGREQDCVGGCFEAYQDFNGVIDEIRFYNRILSASEVQQFYQQ